MSRNFAVAGERSPFNRAPMGQMHAIAQCKEAEECEEQSEAKSDEACEKTAAD